MRLVVMTAGILAVAMCNSLCAEPLPDAGRDAIASFSASVSDSDIRALIRDLNRSSAQNRKARVRLPRLGDRAEDLLIAEAGLAETARPDSEDAARAVRAMRVLRDMKSQALVDTARKVLLDIPFGRPTRNQGALYAEALSCLYDNFDEVLARDVYVEFVTRHSEKYVEEFFKTGHWGTSRSVRNLRMDVIYGIPLLIKSGDKRAREVVAYFIRTLSHESYEMHAVCFLAENGYDIKYSQPRTGDIRSRLLSTSK